MQCTLHTNHTKEHVKQYLHTTLGDDSMNNFLIRPDCFFFVSSRSATQTRHTCLWNVRACIFCERTAICEIKLKWRRVLVTHTWIMIALIQTLLFWFHAFFYCLFSCCVPQVHPSLILCMKDWRVYNNRILLHFRREKREISKKQQKCFLLHKRLWKFTFSLRYRFVTHTKK